MTNNSHTLECPCDSCVPEGNTHHTNPVTEKLATGKYVLNSDYTYTQQIDDMSAIFFDGHSQTYQEFVARPDGYSGWTLIYDGMEWEFCRTLQIRELLAYGIEV